MSKGGEIRLIEQWIGRVYVFRCMRAKEQKEKKRGKQMRKKKEKILKK